MTTKPKASTLPQYTYVFISETASLGVRATSDGLTASKDAWALVPGGLSPVNLAPLTNVVPQLTTIKGQNAAGGFAAVGGSINITPGTGSGGNVSGNVVIKDTAGNGGWNTAHLVIGVYHLWVDGSGRLRVKSSAPTSDTDGTVVGTQV